MKDHAERDRLLQDEMARACVTVLVALLPLTTRSRDRVLAFVADQLHEDAASAEERNAGAVAR